MNKLIHDTSLYEDIPDGTGRLPREMAVYELLSRLEIPFKRMDHEAMATIEACREKRNLRPKSSQDSLAVPDFPSHHRSIWRSIWDAILV